VKRKKVFVDCFTHTHTHTQVYDVIVDCLAVRHMERPSFIALYERLKDLLNTYDDAVITKRKKYLTIAITGVLLFE
jgi:hypothetical protein